LCVKTKKNLKFSFVELISLLSDKILYLKQPFC